MGVAPAVVITDPEFRTIGKAIRMYLRNEYAHEAMGLGEAPPLRISAYNGKGLGRWQSAPDGRPEWSPEFARWIDKSELRTATDSLLRFGYAEVDAAMVRLKAEHVLWYEALLNIDVQNGNAEDYAKRVGVDLSTVKRRRKRGTFYIYAALRMTPERSTRRVPIRSIQISKP